jgi:hypothetical protein
VFTAFTFGDPAIQPAQFSASQVIPYGLFVGLDITAPPPAGGGGAWTFVA